MKQDIFNLTGKINTKGQPMIYDMDKFKQWCKDWPDKKMIFTVEIIDDSSIRQYVYFKKYIIPEMLNAMYEVGNNLLESQLIEFIEETCPLFKKPNGEAWKAEKMTKERLKNVIEWCIQFTSENLGYSITT